MVRRLQGPTRPIGRDTEGNLVFPTVEQDRGQRDDPISRGQSPSFDTSQGGEISRFSGRGGSGGGDSGDSQRDTTPPTTPTLSGGDSGDSQQDTIPEEEQPTTTPSQERAQDLQERRKLVSDRAKRENVSFQVAEARTRSEQAREIRQEAQQRGEPIETDVQQRQFVSQLQREQQQEKGTASGIDLLLGGGGDTGGIITTRQVDTIEGTPVNEIIVIKDDGSTRTATSSEIKRFNDQQLTVLPVDEPTTRLDKITGDLRTLETQSLRGEIGGVGGVKQFGLTIAKDVIQTGLGIKQIVIHPIQTISRVKDIKLEDVIQAGQGIRGLGTTIRQQPGAVTGIITSTALTTVLAPTLAIRGGVKGIQLIKPTKFSTKFVTTQQGELGKTVAITTRKGIIGERKFISGTKSISRIVDGKSATQSFGSFTEFRGFTLGGKGKLTTPELFFGAELGGATPKVISSTIAKEIPTSIKIEGKILSTVKPLDKLTVTRTSDITKLKSAGATLSIDDFISGKKPKPFLSRGIGLQKDDFSIILGREVPLKRARRFEKLPKLRRQERGESLGIVIKDTTKDVDVISPGGLKTTTKTQPFAPVQSSIENAIKQSIKPSGIKITPTIEPTTQVGFNLPSMVGGQGLVTLPFQGSGQFERTDFGGATPTAQAPRISSALLFSQDQKVIQPLKSSLATEQVQKQVQRNLFKDIVTPRIRVGLGLKVAQAQAQALRQQLRLRLRTPTPTRQGTRFFRFPVRPRGFIIPRFRKPKQLFKTGKFQLFVKERGQFKPRGTFRDIAKAQARGVDITSASINRSFKILGGKSGVPLGFRRSRARGQQDVFVERALTSLSQPGEQLAVQFGRARKKRRKKN